MGSNPIRVTNFHLISLGGIGTIAIVVYGGLAQLGEHLPYKQRVGGSNPSASTIYNFLLTRGGAAR